jgi:hypothetical protein
VTRPTFTVRASVDQSARWTAAAEYEGAPSVAAWLAHLASVRLRELGSCVPRMSLHWRRATFRVRERAQDEGREVAGIAAGPFGIHKDAYGAFQLVHTPTGCPLIALPRQGRCKTLARELATFHINWTATDPAEVKGPGTDHLHVALITARQAATARPVEGG